MLRKWFCALLVCLLLVGCQNAPQNNTTSPTRKPHVHDFQTNWEQDTKTHWPICDCGQIAAASEHQFADGVCTVCGYKKPLDPTQVENLAHWQRLFADAQFENVTFCLEIGSPEGVLTSIVRVDGNRAVVAEKLTDPKQFDEKRVFCRLQPDGYERWSTESMQWEPYKTGQNSGLRALLQDVFDDDIFEDYLLPSCATAVYDTQLQAYVLENEFGRQEFYVRDGKFVEWYSRYENGYHLRLTVSDYGITVV